MAEQPKRFFDLWFVQANTVTKEVPFHVVTDWVQQNRAVADDKVRPSGTSDWYPLGSVNAFQPYFPSAELPPSEEPEEIAPVELEPEWPRSVPDDDDDVDMIPLIDISLVLLIFFMMTMTVSAISRIKVPDMQNATTIETNPEVVRIDIDVRDGGYFYALGLGINAPAAEDDKLESDVVLKQRLDARLSKVVNPPKVRIAAHGDVPYEVVSEILSALEDRRLKGQISEVAVEVNERAKP
ncbi:MAG TPA: biopolymer transporter ExbD [Gemmataceae bacterium]|jgi:biopolymer transport protein ExbD|nr:biopolymer transporter ExbD [Gemmataceae bacterium]